MTNNTKGHDGLLPRYPVGGRRGPGIAFDIGTTTIVGALVGADGTVLGAASRPNPQSKWGKDVVARINAAVKEPALLTELKACVIDACNGIIEELAQTGEIAEITVAGNTVMEHLFLGVSPEPLSKVPYRPAFKEAQRLKAKELGLKAGDDTILYAFPLIGGFVGGDSVAALISLGMHREKTTALAIDIGTNSEIMLSHKGVIYATSAAAGPAFEGGEVSSGMTAQKGAIQSVTVDGDRLAIDVIGGVAPVGICGSGLLDAVSALLSAGVIEKSGRIKGRAEVGDNLHSKIRETAEGNAVVLYKGAKNEVVLKQDDVRALQTAKSAIRAGIAMLLKKAGIEATEVEKVSIAGAFGSNIKKEALHKIGVLDEAWLSKIESAGDAALTGAILALSDDYKKDAEEVAAQVKYVSLSGSAHFEKEFIRNIDFITYQS